MTDYTSPYDALQYKSVSADSWNLCKFFKEQLAQNPRKAQQFALKTIKGGIEFVFVAYLGLCLNGLGKKLISRASKSMKKVYNFALCMYNRSSYDFTSQFISITKIDNISGLISRAIQHVDGGVEGNKKIKSVKLNAKMK